MRASSNESAFTSLLEKSGPLYFLRAPLIHLGQKLSSLFSTMPVDVGPEYVVLLLQSINPLHLFLPVTTWWCPNRLLTDIRLCCLESLCCTLALSVALCGFWGPCAARSPARSLWLRCAACCRGATSLLLRLAFLSFQNSVTTANLLQVCIEYQSRTLPELKLERFS